MSHNTRERLYNLLPAIYRLRDTTQGSPLRALLAVIESELELIEGDIDELYRNEFIETCAEWVVPYIGDLLEVRGIHAIDAETFSLRPYVANTLAYRQRKGTAAVLEQLARDVTGWPTRVVEFFQLLATTQYPNHLRPENFRTPDLRQTDQLELLGSPFESVAYTAEVRRIQSRRGKYNIPNIGLFQWRLQNYAVTRSTARAVTTPPDGRYWFNPLGGNTPLFNRPQTETEISHEAFEINVPSQLRRRPLYDELEARRQALVDGEEIREAYFGSQPVLQVFTDDQSPPLAPEEILICDLSGWDAAGWSAPASQTFNKPDATSFQTQVAVDPALGRLAFLTGVTPPEQPEVSYAYGFSSDVGGGPYDRQKSMDVWYNPLDRPVTWQIGVTQDPDLLTNAPDPTQLVGTLQDAVAAWHTHVGSNPSAFGVIVIMDSRTYKENLTGSDKIEIPAESRLAIVAADWPLADVPDMPGQKQRIVGQLTPNDLRPHLWGNLSVLGTGATDPGELILDGLLIEGKVTVLAGNLGSLRIGHCTLVPNHGGVQVNASATDAQARNNNLRITVERSICGPINLTESAAELWVADSIIDHPSDTAIHGPQSGVDVQTSTIFGKSLVRSLEAGNSIFTDTVIVEQRQIGCVRFSFVKEGSRTPRRYRCQPAMEIQTQTEVAKKNNPALTKAERDAIAAEIAGWLVPIFTSTQYGHPAYGQLHQVCPEQIKTGAEDGSEMGVFSHLKHPQREANLRNSLEEYLRFGLEAGIFFVN